MATLEKIAEAQAKANNQTPATSAEDAGYVEKLIAQIIRNIQITINDVHIR